MTEYAQRSAAARERLDVEVGVRYGQRPEESFDLFPARDPGGPLLVFVHGGYWQEVSKNESAFMAPDLVPAGVSVAALGYGLAPAYTLPEIIAMAAGGIRWICANLDHLPGKPGSVYLAGCSAGAHLIAMALLDEVGWRRTGTRAVDAVAGAILLSGVYDLEPVARTYVNAPLGLDTATARACSPTHHLGPALPPLVVARGEHETDEFGRQQREFVHAVRALGGDVTDLVARSRNHFDLAYDLGRPGTELGDATAKLLGRREKRRAPHGVEVSEGSTTDGIRDLHGRGIDGQRARELGNVTGEPRIGVGGRDRRG
ncbi:alpha/beta hydrolase [Actinokineospora sp. HBU206404]|uniref:Alpha/beta hydrolase n=2 Tax=Actinokineospora xionganensis TaxID=2684470 RepID=A0ABR7L4R0_9PSEU|nr:alpha/beta hydrolase [Actinokineospora xionganensis]